MTASRRAALTANGGLAAGFVTAAVALAGAYTENEFIVWAALAPLAATAACLAWNHRQSTGQPGPAPGRWVARVGLVLAVVGFAAGVALLPAVVSLRDAANRDVAAQRLHQLVLALHSYHDEQGHLPGPAITAKDKAPLLSWRVAILPHLKEPRLYQEFHLDEPWDSPHNATLLSRMPAVFAPAGDVVAEPFTTPFQALVGPGAAFDQNWMTRLSDFTDGPRLTILLAEASQTVPWTRPADLTFAPNGPLPPLGRVRGNRNLWLFRRPAPAFLVAMADGAVQTVSKRVPEATLRAAITRHGDEVMAEDWWAAPKAGR
jgi:hypothetical protein